MDLEKQNILFFTRTMGYGGAEKIMLQMCLVLKPLVQSITVVSGAGVKVENLREMGIKYYEIPDFKNMSPKTVLRIAKILCMIIKHEQITIVHTHQRMAAFYIEILRKYSKCIFINTCHNAFIDKKFLTGFAYRHANLIACGEMVKRSLMDMYHIPESRITVIRNAVAPFTDSIRPEAQLIDYHAKGYFVVGNIGRLSEQKGMEYFVQAIPRIIMRCPETRFLIIGTGEDEEKLKKMVLQLSIQEYVSFMGYRTDVQNLMAQMDLVVLSSLWEGLPLTPIEAFSVRKTVVATAVDGTVEIVKNGENGWLIPPRDSDAIAEKVINLIEHPEVKAVMEEEGYRTYMSTFNMDAFSENVREYYQAL